MTAATQADRVWGPKVRIDQPVPVFSEDKDVLAGLTLGQIESLAIALRMDVWALLRKVCIAANMIDEEDASA